MTSTVETGHAKNVANLGKLIGFCSGYGDKYNPANPRLTVERLQALRESALVAISDVQDAVKSYETATNARVNAFKDVNTLSARAVSAFASAGADPLALDDVKGLLRKITGQRAPAPAKPAAPEKTGDTGPTPRTISVSQLSFDSKLNNFTALVKSLAAEKLYNPNETELQPKVLQQLVDSMTEANEKVIVATSGLSNARIARNQLFYQPANGMVDITRNVKQYLHSIFGARDPKYKQVAALEFKKQK